MILFRRHQPDSRHSFTQPLLGGRRHFNRGVHRPGSTLSLVPFTLSAGTQCIPVLGQVGPLLTQVNGCQRPASQQWAENISRHATHLRVNSPVSPFPVTKELKVHSRSVATSISPSTRTHAPIFVDTVRIAKAQLEK